MNTHKSLNWIFPLVLILVLIGVFLCAGLTVDSASKAMTVDEKKANLQEQLAEELRNNYMGDDNTKECQRLIKEIDKLDN